MFNSVLVPLLYIFSFQKTILITFLILYHHLGEVLQRLQCQRQGLQCGLEGGGGLRKPNVDTKQIYYQTINMTSWHQFSILFNP